MLPVFAIFNVFNTLKRFINSYSESYKTLKQEDKKVLETLRKTKQNRDKKRKNYRTNHLKTVIKSYEKK